MPQLLRIGPYSIYFWSNEGDPLEPIHVHISCLLYTSMRRQIGSVTTGHSPDKNQRSRDFRKRNGIVSGCLSLIHILELDGDTVDKKFMDEVVYMLALEDKPVSYTHLDVYKRQKIEMKCYNARRFRAGARLRNDLDIAPLPCYNLTSQIQTYSHTLLIVYFFLTIEAPKDGKGAISRSFQSWGKAQNFLLCFL